MEGESGTMTTHQHRPYSVERQWRVGVVILAAGRGERFGRGPKAALELAGKPLIDHVVASMGTSGRVAEMVVTAPEDFLAETTAMLRTAQSPVPAHVVAGGPTRQASVRIGLSSLSPAVDWVAITDVARPLVPRESVDVLISSICESAARVGRQPCGAVPVLPIVDSLHLVDGEGPALAGPFDRDRVRAAQTPQFFRRDCITDAYEAAGRDGVECTDDVGAMSRIGGLVVPAPGASGNIKVTFADDLRLAEALYARSMTDTR